MRVLVVVASEHRTTQEIADEIADVVRRCLQMIHGSAQVDVRHPDDVAGADAYDAVIVGSSLDAGRWLQPAREFVERNADALAERPVWLFSSGPRNDTVTPDVEPADVAAVRAVTLARGHRHFAGKVAQRGLDSGERAIIAVAHADTERDGEFRDWADVEAWATVVAYELRALLLSRR
jgi:menaquinone-dependent protoporphyrinogen oxidase